MLFLQISRIFIISVVHMPSVGSSLLLRISPHTFAFIPISSMSLSSLNRSNCKAFRHIMPYSAPLCKALHYSKTGLPWQMKSTLIIIFILLQKSSNPFISSVSLTLLYFCVLQDSLQLFVNYPIK